MVLVTLKIVTKDVHAESTWQEFANFQLMTAKKIIAMQKRIAATWVVGDAYEDTNA